MSLTKVSYSMVSSAPVSVLDKGADPTGVADSSAAFAAAWSDVKNAGGTLWIPPGNYLLNSQWVCDVVSSKNIRISGYGATLLAGAAVTGFAVKIVGSFNLTVLDIEGLAFNHLNNSTVNGCFNLLGAHCCHIKSCTVQFDNTKAGYTFARLEPSTPGDNDTNCFWCSVENCTTRVLSGSFTADYGVALIGTANATKIKANQFSSVNTAVYIVHEPTSANYGLANGCVISDNDFESIGGEAISVVGKPGFLGITGLRVMSNRVETCPTFFSYQTGGAASLQHSMPPFLMANYCTTGSVTTWVFNPTSYLVTTLEAMTPGFGPTVSNTFNMNAGIDFVFNTSYGLTTRNQGGNSNFDVGFLNQGAYRYWTNPADAKFYVKGGIPTSATDGQVVGTQT